MLNAARRGAFVGAGAASTVFTRARRAPPGSRPRDPALSDQAGRAGQLRTRPDPNRFTLAGAEQAHQLIESGKTAAKVVAEMAWTYAAKRCVRVGLALKELHSYPGFPISDFLGLSAIACNL